MSSYENAAEQAEKPAALLGQLDEPVVWLSAAQASVVAAHPGLAALGLALPCWAPQRLVGRALGHDPGGVDAAVAHLGRSYAWATEFENVHSFWRYDEPPLTIGGRVYAGSEAYYHAQKPQPWDKALWDRRKRRVMETAVRAKLAADPGGLRELLLATGQHPLLSLKRDAVWGFDPVTARGENLLAEIWMQLRAELQLAESGSLAVADAADGGTELRPPREPIESKEPKLARCEVLLFACSRSPELATTMGESFKPGWAEYIALHDLLLASSTPFLMFDNSSWWDLHPSSHIDASPLTVDKIAEALRTHRPRIVHVGMHGDPAGFAMQWDGEKRCRVRLGASDIRERLDLRGAVVVSSACSTGSVGLGEAILAAGAIAYVAPRTKIAINRLGGFMSELMPRCARALSAADVRRCLAEALDAPSADGPTFREWYGSFFVFARDAPTLVIGISGCTRSGKSTLASVLAKALGASKTAVIRQDRFASKGLAAQAEGGWESTDSIDFKAFRDVVVEASKSKHFVIVEGFRAFASRPPGGVVDLLHHLVWIELSREACYERRMATTRVTEEYFDRNLWPRHYKYWESCFGEGGPMPQLVLDGTKPPTLLLQQVLVALGLPAPAPAPAPPPPARPASAAAAWFDGSLKKLHDALADVEPGTRVGVVTLLGSLCPVTRGHTRAFIEARRILLGVEAGVARPANLEPFGAVLGLISLNGSSYVDRKLAKKGEASLSAEKRLALVKMAAEELPWLSWESCREGETVGLLRQTHPHLHFVHFFMNGADDVVRYNKFADVGPQYRMIVLGRPGFTEKALAGARRAGVDLDAGHLVMGPELPDISSSAAREALARGDRARAAALLHPAVLAWCEEHGPWRAGTASARDGSSVSTH